MKIWNIYPNKNLKTVKTNVSVDEFIDKISYEDALMILDLDEGIKMRLRNKLNKLTPKQFGYYKVHFIGSE